MVTIVRARRVQLGETIDGAEFDVRRYGPSRGATQVLRPVDMYGGFQSRWHNPQVRWFIPGPSKGCLFMAP